MTCTVHGKGGHLGRHLERLLVGRGVGDATFFVGQAPGWHGQDVVTLGRMFEGNAFRALRAFEAAPGWFCYASSGSVYSTDYHPTPYVQSKRLGEHLLRAHAASTGKPLLIVRPFGLYGPGGSQNLLARLRAQLEAGGHITVDRRFMAWTHVEDAARALVAAAEERLTGTYDLRAPATERLDEVAKAMQIEVGRGSVGFASPLPPPLGGAIGPSVFEALGLTARGVLGGVLAEGLADWFDAEPVAFRESPP